MSFYCLFGRPIPTHCNVLLLFGLVCRRKTLSCVGIGLPNQAMERHYHVWESVYQANNRNTLPCVGIGLPNQAIERPYHVCESVYQTSNKKILPCVGIGIPNQTIERHYHVWEFLLLGLVDRFPHMVMYFCCLLGRPILTHGNVFPLLDLAARFPHMIRSFYCLI
jgi:hypothetical protein